MDLVFSPDRIETWPVERLRPYAGNAKMHGSDQVAKIAASMAKFGWTVPCMVADDGELIAGHGRVLAASMLGLKEVPGCCQTSSNSSLQGQDGWSLCRAELAPLGESAARFFLKLARE
ncbi:ParB-like nuclease family protein [Aliiruegeria haliotis]|uniref:ParB-like nuclease family protein n=1 Tax=Aliiruegeria haliotis TaxID=1280846 RepID=A0A2T0RUM9_9RHOB|nr:ParB-like nuclease family protein [Aliiruegeria haliotis]